MKLYSMRKAPFPRNLGIAWEVRVFNGAKHLYYGRGNKEYLFLLRWDAHTGALYLRNVQGSPTYEKLRKHYGVEAKGDYDWTRVST